MQKTENQPEVKSKPWWHYGDMWLVVGGPLLVVIASFITLYMAIKVPDPVVDANYYQNGININKKLNAEQTDSSMVPAIQARNHAATGAKPSN